MNKNREKYLIIGGIILVILIGYFFIKGQTNQFIETNVYDADGNLIKQNAFSVVNNIEGVSFVSFDINIENKDRVALTFLVKSITPSSVDSKKPTNKITIEPGQKGTLTTGLIETKPFENNLQEFCVTVSNDAITGLRESQDKKGCISLDIKENPTGNFDILVDSDLQNPNINPGCTENIQCSAFGECINGFKLQSCSDVNNCGTIEPYDVQEPCSSQMLQTFLVNNRYDVSGAYIILNNLRYDYSGISSYSCLIENEITKTPEGFFVCSRPTYDILSRVYVDIGDRGVIFRR